MARNQLSPNALSLANSQQQQQDIDNLKKEAQKIREDFLIIFGLLAAVIAFLTAEVQAFKELTSFAYLVGFSAFLVAAILSFVVGLQVIVRSGKNIFNYWPTLVVIAIFLVIAGCAFHWGVFHELFWWKSPTK